MAAPKAAAEIVGSCWNAPNRECASLNFRALMQPFTSLLHVALSGYTSMRRKSSVRREMESQSLHLSKNLERSRRVSLSGL